MKACVQGFNPDYTEEEPTPDEVLQLPGYAVLEFGAPWCGHCQAASPVVQDALARHDLSHIKVFDGRGKKLGRYFKVKLWPTLILLKDGEERLRVVRPRSLSDLRALIDKVGAAS